MGPLQLRQMLEHPRKGSGISTLASAPSPEMDVQIKENQDPFLFWEEVSIQGQERCSSGNESQAQSSFLGHLLTV